MAVKSCPQCVHEYKAGFYLGALVGFVLAVFLMYALMEGTW